MKMVFLLFIILLMNVPASGEPDKQCAATCATTWNQATGAMFDATHRCSEAKKYRKCLEKECQMPDVPISLQIEESLQCNMPAFVPGRMTPCEFEQSLCHANWVNQVIRKQTAEQRCEEAHKFRGCLLKTMTELRCKDFGRNKHELQKELQVNCVGDDGAECVRRQEECRADYYKTKSRKKWEKCKKAVEYRQCLVNIAETLNCRDSIKFPTLIDKVGTKNCRAFIPRPACKKLEEECKRDWDLVSGATLPSQLRCKHARKWVHCLENILLDGGCPGGYTVNVEAQVERTLSCPIAAIYNLNPCLEEKHRCWTRFEVKRKYEDDKEKMCDNVLEAKACTKRLEKSHVCSYGKEDLMDSSSAEKFWCKERIRAKNCKDGKSRCGRRYERTGHDGSDRCKAAEVWQQCFLDVVQREGCPEATIPTSINTAIARHCYAFTDPCEDKKDECGKETFYNPKNQATDECERARDWRRCLEDIKCLSPSDYPFELDSVETRCR